MTKEIDNKIRLAADEWLNEFSQSDYASFVAGSQFGFNLGVDQSAEYLDKHNTSLLGELIRTLKLNDRD